MIGLTCNMKSFGKYKIENEDGMPTCLILINSSLAS